MKWSSELCAWPSESSSDVVLFRIPVVENIQFRPGVLFDTCMSGTLPPTDHPLTPYGISWLFECHMYRPVIRQLLFNW